MSSRAWRLLMMGAGGLYLGLWLGQLLCFGVAHARRVFGLVFVLVIARVHVIASIGYQVDSLMLRLGIDVVRPYARAHRAVGSLIAHQIGCVCVFYDAPEGAGPVSLAMMYALWFLGLAGERMVIAAGRHLPASDEHGEGHQRDDSQ